MCQLCSIKQLAARDRWPKPLESQRSNLGEFVDFAHTEYEKFRAEKQKHTSLSPPASLLELLRDISNMLEALETDREMWWKSPEKRALRQRLEADDDQKKLTELHKINNTAAASIETFQAKLGGFVKWSLGMNGGIWELKNCDKISNEGVKVDA